MLRLGREQDCCVGWQAGAAQLRRPKIREAKGKYSLSDCQGASGNKKSFCQCMSGSNNHVTGCDKRFKH